MTDKEVLKLNGNYRFRKSNLNYDYLSKKDKDAVKRVYQACYFPLYFNAKYAFNHGYIFVRYLSLPWDKEVSRYVCGYLGKTVMTVHVDSGIIFHWEEVQFNENCL